MDPGVPALPKTAESRASVTPLVYARRAPTLPPGYRSPPDRPIRLLEIDFYVTMACNIRCEFCNVRAGEYYHRDIPLDRVKSILDDAAALGLQECHFLGGEPTLRHDLEDMVAHTVRLGLHNRVITNGMLLPRKRLRNLIDAGLHDLMVSVDGLEATHNRLRRCAPDGWRTTMRCIADALDLGLRTRVNLVAFRDNADEVITLMELVERMGVHVYSVFLGSPLGRGREMRSSVLGPHAWRALQHAVTERAASMRADFQIIMEQGFAWSDRPPIDRSAIKGRGTGCNTLLEDYDYLIVRSDGNLYQCVFFMTEGMPIGNVMNQPLEPTLQYALDVASYRPFTVAQDRCRHCAHQEPCGTGCRGYAYLQSGDWLKTDARCGKTEPRSPAAPPYYPLCPIMKLNVRTGLQGGSSEQALARTC